MCIIGGLHEDEEWGHHEGYYELYEAVMHDLVALFRKRLYWLHRELKPQGAKFLPDDMVKLNKGFSVKTGEDKTFFYSVTLQYMDADFFINKFHRIEMLGEGTEGAFAYESEAAIGY